MASQGVGDHGPDLDVQYAKFVLNHALKYAEEKT